MSSIQGYYSLLQYSEYPERIEFVNIGVVLFTDAVPRVFVRFSDSSYRAEKVFGVSLGKQFQLIKESMETRLKTEFSGSWDQSSIQRFVSMRAGKVRLSPPKSVLVKDPHKTIDDLFDRLVSSKPRAPRGPQARTKLKQHFLASGVENLLEQPAPIDLPQGVTIKAPYAYHNGSYNLINAVSLREDPDQAIASASKHAIEGQWLFENDHGQKRLVIVGDLEGQRQEFATAIEDMMGRHEVWFYRMANLEQLVDDIRKNVIHQ